MLVSPLSWGDPNYLLSGMILQVFVFGEEYWWSKNKSRQSSPKRTWQMQLVMPFGDSWTCCWSHLWEVLLMVQKSGEKTTWDVKNSGINYQPQLVQDFWTINSMNTLVLKILPYTSLEINYIPLIQKCHSVMLQDNCFSDLLLSQMSDATSWKMKDFIEHDLSNRNIPTTFRGNDECVFASPNMVMHPLSYFFHTVK